MVSKEIEAVVVVVEDAAMIAEDAVMIAEVAMMGLRLVEGLEATSFAQRTGVSLDQAFSPDVIGHLIEAGYLERSPDRMAATMAGRQRLNAVLEALLNT